MIASVTFTVRDPIATNRYYARRGAVAAATAAIASMTEGAVGPDPGAAGKFGGGKGLFITREGKAYKHRVTAAAAVARFHCAAWPADPWRVAHARVSYQLFDYRGDTDGVRKALRDACEGILFANDRVVEDGPAPLPIQDGAGRRVVVTVDLLALRTPAEARALAEAAITRKIARIRRKAARKKSA